MMSEAKNQPQTQAVGLIQRPSLPSLYAAVEELIKSQQAAKQPTKPSKRVDIVREGTKIVLPNKPKDMSPKEAIAALELKIKEEEEILSIHEEVQAFPLEGAYAFQRALEEVYGFATPQTKQTFFGPRPPTSVGLNISPTERVQVIWGEFKIPGLEDGILECTAGRNDDGQLIFILGGQVKKKFQTSIRTVVERTREIVKEESIYRGKAIRMLADEEGQFDSEKPPQFLDTTKVNEEELTFSREVMSQIQTNLFAPIEFTQACRINRIPLKRGVLLEGKYGTGKTLTAFVTAKKCEENGWTFIMLDRVSALQDALKFAKQYAPAVIFAEDIDREVSGERSVKIDDVLNTIDGLDSKGQEIITILTSNHVENINKAMLRPGRLDAIIHVHAPDADAVEKLIRIYAGKLIHKDTDLSPAKTVLAGQIPAVIRECVERSKLYAIWRGAGKLDTLQGEDIANAARGMEGHLELMQTKVIDDRTPQFALGTAMVDLVKLSLTEHKTMKTLSKALR